MHDPISLEALAVALAERDAATNAHCARVSRLAHRLGRRCGLRGEPLDILSLASRFHDVGKIGIPDRVLFQPGRLCSSDWTIMQTHSERGERIFAATGHRWKKDICRLIRHHHEALDGSGYPDGLQAAQQDLSVRILRVVDCYDAMVSKRPYGLVHSRDEAMALLRADAGVRVDAEVLAKFEALLAGD